MAAAHHNLRTLCLLIADLDDERLHPRTALETLIRNLLAEWHDRFGVAEVEDHCAMVRLLHDASDQVTVATLIDVEDLGALGIAQALQDDLLCCLRTDAAEVARRVLPFA